MHFPKLEIVVISDFIMYIAENVYQANDEKLS